MGHRVEGEWRGGCDCSSDRADEYSIPPTTTRRLTHSARGGQLDQEEFLRLAGGKRRLAGVGVAPELSAEMAGDVDGIVGADREAGRRHVIAEPLAAL